MTRLGKYIIELMAMLKVLANPRTIWMALLPIAAMFYLDPAWTKTLLQITCSTIALVGVSHVLRKLMFPGFDLGDAMKSACVQPLGAAIVVFSVVMYLAVLAVLLAGSLK